MTEFLQSLLTLILIYGYPVVCGVILLGYVGIPVPASSILLAAGAFCVSGRLNIYILIPLAIITAVVGDVFGYYVGKKIGGTLIHSHGHRIGLTPQKMLEVQAHLQKWGGGSIFITRWLITPLGVPVDLLAGMQAFPFKKFCMCALAGEALWVSLYVSLGYVFGVNWQMLLDYIGNAPKILALISVGFLCLYLSYHVLRRRRNLH